MSKNSGIFWQCLCPKIPEFLDSVYVRKFRNFLTVSMIHLPIIKISMFTEDWGKHRHLDITNSFWQQVTARRIRVRKRDKVIVFVCCYCTNGILSKRWLFLYTDIVQTQIKQSFPVQKFRNFWTDKLFLYFLTYFFGNIQFNVQKFMSKNSGIFGHDTSNKNVKICMFSKHWGKHRYLGIFGNVQIWYFFQNSKMFKSNEIVD